MDTKLKAKWVKALLSGDYAQGQTNLYNPTSNTYCCLGVLGVCMGIPKDDLGIGHEAYMAIHAAVDGRENASGLWGVNDDNDCPPFDVIAGLIDEAL